MYETNLDFRLSELMIESAVAFTLDRILFTSTRNLMLVKPEQQRSVDTGHALLPKQMILLAMCYRIAF